MKKTIGVLGGMGPLATVDFMHRVIEMTPATRDQDHVPMMVHAVPQVPDRTGAILSGGESPLPSLLQGLKVLNTAGVGCVAIPCNTAHYWYEEMAGACPVPILHIVDAVCADLKGRGIMGGRVGLLATTGTTLAGVYQSRLEHNGYESVVPDADDLETLVSGGIGRVKAGDLPTAQDLLEQAAERLMKQDVQTIILGCTEIPIVLNDENRFVDCTRALARACVNWYFDGA
jgi:aspartate racemase